MSDNQLSRAFGPVGQRIYENNQYTWAKGNFAAVLRDMIMASNARSVLEVGGGRKPMLSQADIAELGCGYTVNDVSQHELDRGPSYTSKVRFDIGTADAAELAPFVGRYDFIFSRMVFEHLKDASQGYRNVHALLKDGGVCLNFHPVLYSLPFLVNWLFPDRLTRMLLPLFQRGRNDDGLPKFAAYYGLCRVGRRDQERLRDCGFSLVHQQAFFNHPYFHRVPPLERLDHKIGDYFARKQINAMASFCYTIVQK